MTSVTSAPERTNSARLWVMFVAAGAAWVLAYSLNSSFWDFIIHDSIGLDPESRVGSSVAFFVYDTTKILLLLVGIVFVVGVMRSFITAEHTRRLLGGRREGLGNVAAAGFGAVTPFCSCSSVPVFIGFLVAGVPLGVTLSFLIASPLINEVAVILIFGMFGWKVAAMYVGFGLVVAVVAGYVMGRLRLERWVEPFVFETTLRDGVVEPSTSMALRDRFAMGRTEVRTIVLKIWPYLLIGVGLGAFIHGWAPEELLTSIAGSGNPLAVPIAVVVGVPLYAGAAGILPLVGALTEKGIALGTVLAFMMAVVALSVPEMILLRRVLQPRLLALFIGIIAAGIIACGYLFNLVIA